MGIQAIETYPSRDYSVKSTYAVSILWCLIVCDIYHVVRMDAKRLFKKHTYNNNNNNNTILM